VSVVIPTFQRAASVARALESIREPGLAPEDLEVIVVDNASTDSTEQVVARHGQRFPLLTYRKWDENVGPLENWRRGIALATAPWLKILWSDDQLEERAIEQLLTYAERSDARVVTCRVAIDYPNGRAAHRYLDRPTTLTPDIVISELLHLPAGLPSSPGAALVRTEDALATFAADLPDVCRRKAIGPDLLITYWGVFAGGHGVHLPDVLARFSASEDSITVRTPRAVLSSCYCAAMQVLTDHTPGQLTPTTLRRLRSRGALDARLGGEREALIRPRRLSFRASLYDCYQLIVHAFTTLVLRRRTI
jgi:hypothetical protein